MTKIPLSEIPVIERVARFLAGGADDRWRENIDRARALLQEIRTPDAIMAHAGDALVWERMVGAALGEHNGDSAHENVPDSEIRDAGTSQMSSPPPRWSRLDESVDESFPASDPPAISPGVG